jgi:hypothetical protein
MPPHWRLRTLMLGVAVLGSSLGAFGALWRRSIVFRERADFHHVAANILAEQGGSGCMDNGENDELYDPALRRAYLYHRRLGKAYSRAARRPWLSVTYAAPPRWAYPPRLIDVLQQLALE